MRSALWKKVALGATIAAASLILRSADRRPGLARSAAGINRLAADHLKDANLVIFHLAVKTEYDAGHIPGARFITLDDVAVTDPDESRGLMLQMPAADDLRARLEKIGVSDNSRVVISYGRDRIASATRCCSRLDHAGLGARASRAGRRQRRLGSRRAADVTEVPALSRAS
jgi:thiosulfate/3-mercaptopyruvate sulfurtransferase